MSTAQGVCRGNETTKFGGFITPADTLSSALAKKTLLRSRWGDGICIDI